MSNKKINELEYGRIVYYEPNEIFGGDNQPVNQEDLTKFINLSVRVPSRYFNDSAVHQEKKYDTILRGVSFDKDDKYKTFYLTDNYVNVSYNEFDANGNISAGELFGIDSIDISFDVQFFPQVTINFTDVKGFGLMSTMEYNYEDGKINNMTAKSFFTSLFNFPYPIFTLEVKGYYGKSVSFDLSLLDFNTTFDSQTGNFKTTVKFIGHMYGVYADIPITYLMASPYIDYSGNLSDSESGVDPCGKTWIGIDDEPENNIPTYLSLLRNYDNFISVIKDNSDGNIDFSITDKYIANENVKSDLELIKGWLEGIIDRCNTSKSELTNQQLYEDEKVIFVIEKNNDKCNDIEELLEPYKSLIDFIKKKTRYNEFNVTVIKKEIKDGDKDKCVWDFTDIKTKRNDCVEQIEKIEKANLGVTENVNTELKGKVMDIMGLIPNIKNVYKILYKHLDCFSKHFFNTLKSVKKRDNKILAIDGYESDVPPGCDVPPFPAIYKVSGNERTIKYPGEISSLSKLPEVLLTENIFNSIIYFGQQTAKSLEALKNAKEDLSQTTITTNGLFFIDGLAEYENIKNFENKKHYSCINPRNVENYVGDTNVTNAIRDIFLSRLATYSRIHYKSDDINHDGDYIAQMEASLLVAKLGILTDKFLENIKNLKKINNADDIIKRFSELSGGTIENKYLWGYVNYNPKTSPAASSVTKDNVVQLAKEGVIHYNGYSGSTIIVYGEKLDYKTAEARFNAVSGCSENSFNLANGFAKPLEVKECISNDGETEKATEDNIGQILKVECNGSTKYYVVTEKGKVKETPYINERTVSTCQGDLTKEDVYNLCPNETAETYYNTTYYIKEDTGIFDSIDYNHGCITKSVLGEDDKGFDFLFDSYLKFKCTNDSFHGCPLNEFYGGKTLTKINDKNNLVLLNEVALFAIKEYANIKDNKGVDIAIPVSILPTDTVKESEHTSTFITPIEYQKDLLNLIEGKNFDNKYYVIGKNFQYERGNDGLNNEKVFEIWEKFKNKVFELYGLEQNPNTETVENKQDVSEFNKKIKTDIYYTLKVLYDKWYSGLSEKYFNLNSSNCEYKKIHYLTTTFNDISKSMIVDLESLVNQISDAVYPTNGASQSVLRFMAKTAQDNNSSFLVLPIKFNWGSDSDSVNSIFKPYNFYDGTATHDSHGVSYIVMYNGDVSHHLANNKGEYIDDGYNITNYMGSEIKVTEEAKRLFVMHDHDYIVPAFGVTYGMQNQNYFKNISVDTTNPSVTDYSIANTLIISEGGSNAAGENSIPNVKSLYPIYANRSYTCSVDMMGCMNITPLMYFQLNNVPMFKGAYMITNVHHKITPNDFTTSFSGVRVSKFKIPINTDVISLTSILRYRKVDNDVISGNTDIGDLAPSNINTENDIINLDKTGKYFVGYTIAGDCDKSARQTIAKLLHDASGITISADTIDLGSSDRTIRLASEKHKVVNNNIVADFNDNNLYYYHSDNITMKEKYRQTVNLIIAHLNKGYPIRVAVNHSFDRKKGLINDKTADHFIAIYAYGVIETFAEKTFNKSFMENESSINENKKNVKDGSVLYFRFYETGASNESGNGVHSRNVLIYVDDDNPLFYCTSDRLKRPLDVVMVFPYTDNYINCNDYLSFELVNYHTTPHYDGKGVRVPREKYKTYDLKYVKN